MKIIVSLVFFVSLFAFGYHDVSAVNAVTGCPNGGAGYALVKGVCIPSSSSTGLSNTAPYEIIVNVMNWLMAMIGIVAILMFVISGWIYLTAGGDEKKTETAKNNIKYTIIGLVVALTAFIIVRLVANLVGASTTGIGTNI
jgi:heme/copper-type cytochrome/quinol oxidase subunit 2